MPDIYLGKSINISSYPPKDFRSKNSVIVELQFILFNEQFACSKARDVVTISLTHAGNDAMDW